MEARPVSSCQTSPVESIDRKASPEARKYSCLFETVRSRSVSIIHPQRTETVFINYFDSPEEPFRLEPGTLPVVNGGVVGRSRFKWETTVRLTEFDMGKKLKFYVFRYARRWDGSKYSANLSSISDITVSLKYDKRTDRRSMPPRFELVFTRVVQIYSSNRLLLNLDGPIY